MYVLKLEELLVVTGGVTDCNNGEPPPPPAPAPEPEEEDVDEELKVYIHFEEDF